MRTALKLCEDQASISTAYTAPPSNSSRGSHDLPLDGSACVDVGGDPPLGDGAAASLQAPRAPGRPPCWTADEAARTAPSFTVRVDDCLLLACELADSFRCGMGGSQIVTHVEGEQRDFFGGICLAQAGGEMTCARCARGFLDKLCV